MYSHEKRLASAKCEPLKNDLAGALINSENTGSVTASQALSPKPVIGILDRITTVDAFKPPWREFVSDIMRYRPPAACAIAAIRMVARGHTERTRS